jgi:hypothetical protein
MATPPGVYFNPSPE